MKAKTTSETLPCTTGFDASHIESAKAVLTQLADTSGDLLKSAGIDGRVWLPLLRATVESMRGVAAASQAKKAQFITTVLNHCKDEGHIIMWESIAGEGRQDYRISLPDGTAVALEAKGCPDGNNTNIWDRPSWADEFVIWSLCPHGLQHEPGEGVWSGISTRLMPRITAERERVTAFIFWDGRCGSELRLCPKSYGVTGIRSKATDIECQPDKEDWLPPPCIYLMPKSYPDIRSNRKPPVHSLSTSKFTDMLLTAFNVPEPEKSHYVHTAEVEAEGSEDGTRIQVSVTSRCWPDASEHTYTGKWKTVTRNT